MWSRRSLAPLRQLQGPLLQQVKRVQLPRRLRQVVVAEAAGAVVVQRPEVQQHQPAELLRKAAEGEVQAVAAPRFVKAKPA